jgi:serine/threonine protein kinase
LHLHYPDYRVRSKVADFGTSKYTLSNRQELDAANAAICESGSASMTRAVGTQLWMAPEVFFGRTGYGPEIDVYSFGIIMWELATRKTPWCELEAEDYIDQFRKLDAALCDNRRPALPNGFEAEHAVYTATLRTCWATDPAKRPSFDQIIFSLRLGVPQTATTTFPGSNPLRKEDNATAPQAPANERLWQFATVAGGMPTAASTHAVSDDDDTSLTGSGMRCEVYE